MSEYAARFDTSVGMGLVEGENITFAGGGVAELVTVLYNGLTGGEMFFSLISGAVPVDNEAITGVTSGTTALIEAAIVPVYLLQYPAKLRADITIALNGDIRKSANMPALMVTNSCKYDTEATGPFTVGETLTFSSGGSAELITLTDNGLTGELFLRTILLPLPADNDTITGVTSGATALVNGYVHQRSYTPLHIHRILGGLGDDSVSTGDDIYDILKPDASNKQTIEIIELLNGYNVDDLLVEHMYGGSITQAGGATVYSGIDISLTVNNPDTQPVVIQNNIIIADRWRNAHNPDPLKGQVRFMIKTRDLGADIDGKRVRVRILENKDTYFTANTTLGTGVVGVSLFSSSDLNNQSDAALIATWTGTSVVEGYQLIDHLNGSGSRPYIQKWGKGIQTRAELYEVSKWIQSRTTTGQLLHGIDSHLFIGADMNFAFSGGDGIGGFLEDEILTFGNGATALLLGLDTADFISGNMYCQLLTGVTPLSGDTIVGGTTTETAVVSNIPTTRTINTNFLGQFTGTGFITNYGISLDTADVTKDDKYADLLGAVQSPPNNVQFDAGGLAPGEDYVIAATDAGTDFLFNEMAAAAGNIAGNTTFIITGTIPLGRKQAGTLRVQRADGSFDRLVYSSYAGSVFTLVGTLPNTYATAANCFITDIDKLAQSTTESFTVIYPGTARNIRVKARDGKQTITKTSSATGIMGSAGGSATINRISDN